MQTPFQTASGRTRFLAPPIGVASLSQAGLGCLYWLAFLLTLEPGNVLDAVSAGVPPNWGREALRIGGGAFLGGMTTPLLVDLCQRFPVKGATRLRNAAVHLANSAATATALIIVAHFLALWLLDGRTSLSVVTLGAELESNELLLIFSILALTGLIHAGRILGQTGAGRRSSQVEDFKRGAELGARPFALPSEPTLGPTADHLTKIEVKSRGRISWLDVEDVDWIETQGNYLALHAGSATFLIRDTLIGISTRLNPDRFARVHRTSIVALDRIVEVRAAANGDAFVRLRDAREVRVSRLFREDLKRALDGQAPKFAQRQ